MRVFEVAGKVKEVKKAADEQSAYVGIEAGENKVVWVFVPPELSGAANEGDAVFIRGFAKRHAEQPDWWGLVAAQIYRLTEHPTPSAVFTIAGTYGGPTDEGRYIIRGRKGEEYLVDGAAPVGVNLGDDLVARGTPVTPEPGKLHLLADWASVAPVQRFLERPKEKPTAAAASPTPSAPPSATTTPHRSEAPKEEPKKPEKKKGGLFGLFRK